MKNYDLIIIGTGGGNKLASSAVKLGKRVALIEKGKAGGTCLNRGCIPSKMLIYPANRFKSTKDREEEFTALIKRINTHTDSTSDKIDQGRTESEKIDYYKGSAKFISDKVVKVNEDELTADKIIIATGARPLIPNIPGLSHTPFMTSNEALRAKKLPKSLIVIGGGYIATELGGAYAAFGTDVTFLLRSDFVRHIDSEIREIFIKEFSPGKTIYKGTEILEVKYEDQIFKVKIKIEGQEKTIESEELLLSAGVVPNSDQLGLENTQIQISEKGFIEVNQYLETNLEDVFAIGDVAGNYLFRHSVNYEAEYLVESLYLSDKPFPIDYPPMPAAVFTDPEIASVGLTEEEALKANKEIIVGKASYKSIAMAKARELETGMVKLIFDANSHVLIGAHIVGEEAATMIQELVLAASNQLTAQQIYKQIYIHPAFPEIVRNALRDALKKIEPDRYSVLF